MATFLVTGLFGGVFAGVASATTNPACTATSKATCAATLNVASGSFSVYKGTPVPFTTGATARTPTTLPPKPVTGTLDPSTGDLTTVTVPKLQYHLSRSKVNTTSTETIIITQATPKAATATINSKGDVALLASLDVLVTIHIPTKEQCLASMDVNLSSTSAYTKTSGKVTLSQQNFTISNFGAAPSGTCKLAAGDLDGRYAGTTNMMTLSLQGALPLPPPPGTVTTTTLSATPATPQLQGTLVKLTAKITSKGSLATAATGTVYFYNGGTLLHTATVSSGTASFTTKTLPPGTNELHAVYSGDSKYATSTSPTVAYVIEPKPVITLSLPSSVTVGAGPTQFSLKVTNPATGESWSHLRLRLALTGITQTTTVVVTPTLSYKDSGGNWCSLHIGGGSFISASFKGFGTPPCGTPPASFSLSTGSSLTLPLEVSYASTDRVGVQQFTATLYTVTDTGTRVPPFTTSSTSTPPNARGYYTVNPITKYTPVLSSSIFPTYTVPKGFVVVPGVTVRQPATPSTLPLPTGRLQFLVTTVTAGSYTYIPELGGSEAVATSGLSLGAHTLKAKYSGNNVYKTATYTHLFTVGPAPSGTAFTCVNHAASGTPHTVTAAVTVSSDALPASAPSGSNIAVSGLDVTLVYDNYASITTPQTSDEINLSPGGVAVAPSIAPTVTSTIIDLATAKWTGLSATTVPISGAPGSEVNVGVNALHLTFFGIATTTTLYTCTAVSASASLGTVTVATVPDPPTGVTATAGNAQATVSWTAPATDGGSAITGYTVTSSPGGLTCTTTGATTCTVTGLTNGTAYTFTVVATNAKGTSAASAASVAVTPTAGGPVPPPPPPVPTGTGYRLVSSNGSVYAYGTAPFSGSMGGQTLNAPVVGTATTPGDGGYWLVGSDGGIFAFGNAPFYGSMGGKALNKPIVGMAATPTGKGYWEVASDGGIFAFGNATFYGSMGGKALNEPIVGMAATPTGGGYWEVAADGGIFSFANAPFYGTVAGTTTQSVVGITATADGGGYWETAANGQVFQLGDASLAGTALSQALGSSTIVGMSQ